MSAPFQLPSRPCALALLALAACGPRETREPGPGVLVIAIDGLRADHLGVHGYDRATTPTLDALAAEGLLFEDVFASSPLTLPAHVALLTGAEPGAARRFLVSEYEGLTERRWRVPERGPHLAQEFLANGYATAAFLDDGQLSDVHGFDPGFQHFEVVPDRPAEEWEGEPSARVVRRFVEWLGQVEPGRPWFAYVHLHELERFWSDREERAEGYFPPRPGLDVVPPVGNTDSIFFAIPRSRWRGGPRTLGGYEALYDDELLALDQELGRLFARLRRIGRDESTTIHVLGSHGMQFGEAGLYLSSGRYSQADLHVPWVVRPAARLASPRGRRLAGIASTLDLAPTVLAQQGLVVPDGMHGVSQAAVLAGSGTRAAAREFAFASCGLQEGLAVMGERHALEYVLPLGTADAQLRRSWSGSWTALGMQPRLVFHDRLEEPYPPLEAEGNRSDPAQFVRFRAAALERVRDVNDLRLHLQAPPGRSPLEAAVLRRLRDHGLIGGGG